MATPKMNPKTMTADELCAAVMALGFTKATLGAVVGGYQLRSVYRWLDGTRPVPPAVVVLVEAMLEDKKLAARLLKKSRGRF